MLFVGESRVRPDCSFGGLLGLIKHDQRNKINFCNGNSIIGVSMLARGVFQSCCWSSLILYNIIIPMIQIYILCRCMACDSIDIAGIHFLTQHTQFHGTHNIRSKKTVHIHTNTCTYAYTYIYIDTAYMSIYIHIVTCMNTHIHIHINRNTHTHQAHALLLCLISSFGAEITLIPKNQELYTHLSPKSGAACCCRWGGKQKVWAATRGRHKEEVLTAALALPARSSAMVTTSSWDELTYIHLMHATFI